MSAGAVITAGEFLVQPMPVSVAEAAEGNVLGRWRVVHQENGHIRYVARLVDPDTQGERMACTCEAPRLIAAAIRPEACCLHVAAVREALAGVRGTATP